MWPDLSTADVLSSAGTFRGVCKKIDHFPEDADYEADAAEYLLRKSDINTQTQTYGRKINNRQTINSVQLKELIIRLI